MLYSNTHHIHTVWICSVHENTTHKPLVAQQIYIRNTKAHNHYIHFVYIPASIVQKATHVPGMRKDEQQGRPDMKVRRDLHVHFISFHVFFLQEDQSLRAHAAWTNLVRWCVCFPECCTQTCKRWTTAHSHTWVTLLRGCAIDPNLITLRWSGDHWKWGGMSPLMFISVWVTTTTILISSWLFLFIKIDKWNYYWFPSS